MPGALAIPIRQFWFWWTNYRSIHWSISIIGTAPFGFGVILVYLGIMNDLIDSYTIYAASVLAANTGLRSIFGAMVPVLATYMYDGVGISVFALHAISVSLVPIWDGHPSGVQLCCRVRSTYAETKGTQAPGIDFRYR